MADAPVAGAARLFGSDDLDRLRAATIPSYLLYLGVVTMPLLSPSAPRPGHDL
jgi:hypothetical protein